MWVWLVCALISRLHWKSLLLALLEFPFTTSNMPWDIWTIVVIWIIAQILQCWEKIMRMKIFCFEGCYLLTSVLKIVVLTVVFMTLAFSSDLIELILGTQFVNRQSVSQNLFCYSTVICSLRPWSRTHILAV